jgi:plasmid maintenance system antidote protein VapI
MRRQRRGQAPLPDRAEGVTSAEAAKAVGIAESTTSEVLAGQQKLNRGQIGKLSRHFHIALGAFGD